MPGDVSPLAIFVPVVDNWADDIADDLESSLRGAEKRLGFLTNGDNLHLRLAALGDGDGLPALGDFVDQGKALRLEGGGVDLPVHDRTRLTM